MAVPLLVGLTKALVTQAPKLAAKQLGKKAVKNAAKDFVKGKVKDKFKSKREQDKKKKGGALVKTEGGLTKFSMGSDSPSKISPEKLIPQGVDLDASIQTVSAKGKISYDKIQQQLDNIEGVTSALNKAFKQQLDAKKDTAAKAKKAAQTLRKKQREEDREGKKKVDTSSGSLLPKGDPFNIFNFLKNILLGGLVLFLLKQGPKIAKLFGFLKDNLYAVFLGIKYGFKAFTGAFKALGKLLRGTVKAGFKIAGAPFKLAGRVIKTLFGKIGKGIMAFGKFAIKRFKDLLGIKPPPKSGKPGSRKPGSGKTTLTGSGATAAQMRGQRATAGYRSPGRYRMPGQALAGGTFQSQIARRGAPTPRATVRPGSFAARTRQFGASLQTGTANVPLSPGVQRGLSRGAVKTQQAAGAVNTFLKKIFGITDPAQVNSLRNASPALKKGTSFLKGARIPVVGPTIVFIMNALDPDIPVGKAAFKAVGAGLGEFLGLLTPIPGIGQILGPILGGLAGEVLGGAAYELVVNKNPKAAGQEIIDAFMTALEVGNMAVDWLKGAGERFYEAMPKIKIPEIPGWLKRADFLGWLEAIPIWGQEIIEPNLGKIAWAIPGAMKNAVFGTKKEEGEKEELKLPSEKESGLSSTPDGTTTSSMTTTTVSGGGSDFWTLAAVAAMEDSDGQARADVAQSIYNRKASGAYGGGTIRELIIADKQFQPTWDYPRKNTGMKANPEWLAITNAASAAAATGKSVAFINQAAADIQNKQYQDEAKKFVGGRTDFTNYSKTNRKGQVVRSTNAPNNYFGWDWNYQGNTMSGVPNFNTTTTTTQQSNPAITPPGAPISPSPTEAQKKRIQELQKKIAEAEALLKVSGFASGPIANITKQNLATNKAELAKLSAMAMTPMIPQTTSPATVTPQAQTAGSALERAGQTTGTQKGDMVSGYGVTSGYGQRWGKLHGGIDIGTPTGTYVGLSVPVEIVYAGNHGGYGNVIDAWAPSIGLQFRLAHLSRIMVSKGQVVAAGTALGLTGGGLNDPGRGSSTGPHLHFEVDNKKNGTTYGGLGDPSPYVQYIILSKNGPALGAQVTTPGSVTTQRNAGAISQFPSYDANGSNTIILPGQQQQQPVMMGGQSAGGIVLGGSTAAVVNSYYKKQLLGFLYKQG